MIIAAVVCGPGSILANSKVGATYGYSAVWVLAFACLLMIAMVALAARIGTMYEQTPCGEIANRIGRPAAAAIGLVMFLIIAAFQSSNNTAVAAALEVFDRTGAPSIWFAETFGQIKADKNVIDESGAPFVSTTLLIVLNVLIITFLYSSRNVYRLVEWAMKLLVFLMVGAFLVNCIAARPSIPSAIQGLIPSSPGSDSILLIGLFATTFSVAAAFYQAYLVRERGWSEADCKTAMTDSVVGIATFGMICLVIMMTSAASFHGKEGIELDSLASVARQLEPLFGSWAPTVFGIGIFAGAISSFLVNALIGGHVMADGFGLGDRVESKWTLHFTTAALLAGMLVALFVDPAVSKVTVIVFAQALTVIGVPALAMTLIFLGIKKRQEDSRFMPVWILVGATVGLLVTCLMAWRTLVKVIFTLSG